MKAKLVIASVLILVALLGQTREANAQSGYSATLNLSPFLGQTWDAGGTWSTPAGDTIGSITIYWSDDNWATEHVVYVPAANITGQGRTSGTYDMKVTFPSGTIQVYTECTSAVNDIKFYTPIKQITVP